MVGYILSRTSSTVELKSHFINQNTQNLGKRKCKKWANSNFDRERFVDKFFGKSFQQKPSLLLKMDMNSLAYHSRVLDCRLTKLQDQLLGNARIAIKLAI